MKRKLQQIKTALQYRLQILRQEVLFYIRTYLLRASLMAFVAYLAISKDISIALQFDSAPLAAQNVAYTPQSLPMSYKKEVAQSAPSATKPMNVSLLTNKRKPGVKAEKKESTVSTKKETAPPAALVKDSKEKPSKDPNLANTFSNITHKKDESAAKRAAKRKKQMAYVKRFSKVAKTEMEKYGIPASITLAQGLLESNVGASRLATRNNNHFGIKCFSKRCSKGHCSNFTDDSHKDFFRIYRSAWESYRAHSKLLTAKRYGKLYKLKKTDYKGWAKGLKKAGYATDPKYAEKIIALIEDLKLHQYDK